MKTVNQEITNTNIKRLIPFFAVLFVISISNLLIGILTKGHGRFNDVYIILSVVMIAFVLIAGGVCCSFINRKERNTFKLRSFYLFVWAVFVALTTAYIVYNLADDHSMLNYVLLLIALSAIPILNLKQICCLIIPVCAVTYFILYQTKADVCLFQQTVILCFSAVFTSQIFFNSFFKTVKARIELQEQANTDSLTSLINRRGYDMIIESLRGGNLLACKCIHMLMIDIDFFKKFNDRYGHERGDSCLNIISNCIKEGAKPFTNLVVRYGGEEFVVLIENKTDEQVIKMAESLMRMVEDLKISAADKSVSEYVTISVGVATSCRDSKKTPGELFDDADTQLYLAKNYGRNCISFNNKKIKTKSIIKN